MYSFTRQVCLGVALAALAACATGVSGPNLPMAGALSPLLTSAQAPAGLVSFCQRTQEICAAEEAPSGSPFEPGATLGVAAPHASSEDLFQTLLAGYGETAVALPVSRESLTPLRWRELRRVNRQINWDILPASDATLYNRMDVWALPLSRPQGSARRRGDCEDYALEKRQRLLTLGWPPEALSIAIAIAPGQGLHAVLIAHTDRGDFVLDNLHEEPVGVEAVGYSWLSMQTGVDLLQWNQLPLNPGSMPTRTAKPDRRDGLKPRTVGLA